MTTALPTGTLEQRSGRVKTDRVSVQLDKRQLPIRASAEHSPHEHRIQLQAVATLGTATAGSTGPFEAYFEAIVRTVVREELAAALHATAVGPTAARAPSEYLTVARAAEVAALHPCTIREWIKAGSLKAYRCGGRGYRILRTDLDARLTFETSNPTSENLRERVDAILAKRRSKRRGVEVGT